eukprot:g6145.t1
MARRDLSKRGFPRRFKSTDSNRSSLVEGLLSYWRPVSLQRSIWSVQSMNLSELFLGLPFYKSCTLPVNLSEGFPERFIQKPATERIGVEIILEALKTAKVDYCKFGLITFRNNLNKICGTLTDLKKPWMIDACCLSTSPDTVFLDIKKMENEGQFPDSERFSYFGFHFEHCSTVKNDSELVDSSSEFAVVVETKLNQTNYAIAGEVDCFDEALLGTSGDLELSSLIELKTSKAPENERKQLNNQRFKYPKWWLQSTILGVPRVVVGYWRDDGQLIDIQTYSTNDLPHLATRGIPKRMLNQLWSPKQLLGFLVAVIEWMRGIVQENKDRHVQFTYVPERCLIDVMDIPSGDMVSSIRQALSEKCD